MPVAVELHCDFADGAGPTPDLLGEPAPGPSGHRHGGAAICWSSSVNKPTGHDPSGQDHWRFRHISRVGRPNTGRSTSWTDWAILHDDGTAALRAPGPTTTALDVDREGFTGLVVDTEHVHIGQADQKLTHARSIGLHRGSPV